MTEGRRQHEAGLWRKLAHWGARHGPRGLLEFSPPAIGAAFAALLPAERQRVVDNLRRINGRRASWWEVRDVLSTFGSYASCFAESLALERPEAENARLSVTGQHRIESLLASGRGVVLGTAHIGPWDSAARFLARRLSARVMLVMAPEPNAAARELQDALRRQGGVEVVHIGTHALDALPLLRHLREGGVVAMQLDRAKVGARSRDVQLFGRPFSMPEGPFVLAALAQVPILPLFTRRRQLFDYEFEVGAPIELSLRPSPAELRDAAQVAAGAMESFIARYPTQWFHFS